MDSLRHLDDAPIPSSARPRCPECGNMGPHRKLAGAIWQCGRRTCRHHFDPSGSIDAVESELCGPP